MFNQDQENYKHQIPNHKQIPMTQIQNSKQNDPSKIFANVIITGRPVFAKRCDTNVMNILVIEY